MLLLPNAKLRLFNTKRLWRKPRTERWTDMPKIWGFLVSLEIIYTAYLNVLLFSHFRELGSTSITLKADTSHYVKISVFLQAFQKINKHLESSLSPYHTVPVAYLAAVFYKRFTGIWQYLGTYPRRYGPRETWLLLASLQYIINIVFNIFVGHEKCIWK